MVIEILEMRGTLEPWRERVTRPVWPGPMGRPDARAEVVPPL